MKLSSIELLKHQTVPAKLDFMDMQNEFKSKERLTSDGFQMINFNDEEQLPGMSFGKRGLNINVKFDEETLRKFKNARERKSIKNSMTMVKNPNRPASQRKAEYFKNKSSLLSMSYLDLNLK